MRHSFLFFFLVIAFTALGCAPCLAERRAGAASPLLALQAGDFERAGSEAEAVLERDRDNPYARIIRAITRYKATASQLFSDGATAVVGLSVTGQLNEKYLRSALTEAELALAAAQADLEVAAQEPRVSLDLCLACWQHDWNHSGRIDDNDERLMEVELDGEGQDIPEGDPRRRPTFRFDQGDVLWAEAFLAFQRAALNVVLAYGWTDFAGIARDRELERIELPIVAPERMAEAKTRILEGLALADASREAILAETDDEREWLPNPRQRNHPLPLPVDDALFQTWAGVISDLRSLVKGETGISMAELAQLGDDQWTEPPGGYLDIGCLFSEPHSFVFDLESLEALDDEHLGAESALTGLLGSCYKKDMTPSPLVKRLTRMKGEMDRGEESMERKLRYLLWLN